jgi:uncharacterized protein YigE (DUF2233 family)
MSIRRFLLGVVLTLLACAPSAAFAEGCRSESFRGASYIVCSFDPAKDDLRIAWRGPDKRPYKTFAALAEHLQAEGETLRFAMNGGMYEENFRPVGLHIENGRTLTKANTKTVRGRPSQIPNFYKKPNGVFYLGHGRARVMTTKEFLARKPDAASRWCRRIEPQRGAVRHLQEPSELLRIRALLSRCASL